MATTSFDTIIWKQICDLPENKGQTIGETIISAPIFGVVLATNECTFTMLSFTQALADAFVIVCLHMATTS